MRRAVVLQDISGLGRCSLTAAIPVLSALGVQACPVPTAVLTAQTGFPAYSLWDTTDSLSQYIQDWRQLGVRADMLYTGFLAGEHQVEQVMAFVQAFLEENTGLLVDPVMGDDGHLYGPYSADFCRRMKGLTQMADILTPNLTEACLLTDVDYAQLTALSHRDDYLDRVFLLAEQLSDSGPGCVYITGVHRDGHVYNLLLDHGKRVTEASPEIPGARYSGTGDLFASVICGGRARGWPADRTLRLATRFLEQAIGKTALSAGDRNEGVYFEECLSLLTEAILYEST